MFKFKVRLRARVGDHTFSVQHERVKSRTNSTKRDSFQTIVNMNSVKSHYYELIKAN